MGFLQICHKMTVGCNFDQVPYQVYQVLYFRQHFQYQVNTTDMRDHLSVQLCQRSVWNKPENQDEDVLWERSDKCLRLFINVWNISIWKYVRKYVRFCRSYKASDPWQMLFSDQNVGGLSPSQGVGPFSGGYCHCHLTEKYHLGTWLCTLR